MLLVPSLSKALGVLERSISFNFTIARFMRLMLLILCVMHGLACCFSYFAKQDEAAHYKTSPWIAFAPDATSKDNTGNLYLVSSSQPPSPPAVSHASLSFLSAPPAALVVLGVHHDDHCGPRRHHRQGHDARERSGVGDRRQHHHRLHRDLRVHLRDGQLHLDDPPDAASARAVRLTATPTHPARRPTGRGHRDAAGVSRAPTRVLCPVLPSGTAPASRTSTAT